MKTFASLLLLFVLASPDLAEVRKSYPNAASSSESATAFNKLMASVPDTAEPALLAYKGASETMLSKFAGTLKGKTTHMKKGAALIDAAVAADKKNIEIRMIRLSVQENVPKIVKYRDQIKEDKAFIVENFKSSGALKPYISNFVQRSKSFSDEEKKSLK